VYRFGPRSEAERTCWNTCCRDSHYANFSFILKEWVLVPTYKLQASHGQLFERPPFIKLRVHTQATFFPMYFAKVAKRLLISQC
jgi:hypothetical protein